MYNIFANLITFSACKTKVTLRTPKAAFMEAFCLKYFDRRVRCFAIVLFRCSGTSKKVLNYNLDTTSEPAHSLNNRVVKVGL